jgi:hypothetical protein
MLKTKEGTFYIVVNPFTHKCTFSVNINSINYKVDYWYEDAAEHGSINIDGQLYDINIYYDESFWIYIFKSEEGSTMEDVQIEVQLYDNGPTIKLKNKQY